MRCGHVCVSVIIPCYNSAATVTCAIDSVSDQTFTDWEIVAINDGSTDNTKAILESYAQKSIQKIRVFSQPNQGQTVAKNIGIKNSKGKFIAFLDSDDVWAPEKLQEQVAAMESNPSLGLCYTSAYKINSLGFKTGRITPSTLYRGNCFRNLVLRNNIVASSVMIRRDLLGRVGLFDESLEACENWDLWIRISRISPIEYIDKPLTSYRVHGGNMSKNIERMRSFRLKVINKNLPFENASPDTLKLRKKALFFVHMTFAKSYLENLAFKEARGELIQAARLQPAEIGTYKLYLKAILGKRLTRLFRRIKNFRKSVSPLSS